MVLVVVPVEPLLAARTHDAGEEVSHPFGSRAAGIEVLVVSVLNAPPLLGHQSFKELLPPDLFLAADGWANVEGESVGFNGETLLPSQQDSGNCSAQVWGRFGPF